MIGGSGIASIFFAQAQNKLDFSLAHSHMPRDFVKGTSVIGQLINLLVPIPLGRGLILNS
jgi:hypothetical protein